MSHTAIALPERFRPRGVAMLLEPSGGGRVFLCDRKNHFVDVVDEEARPLFSFGGYGAGPGQFNDPCDIVVLLPGDQTTSNVEHLLVAVADRGNGRVQIFDGSGTLVALLGPGVQPPSCRWPRDAWPAVRTAIPSPTRLAWIAPHLEVADAHGHVLRIDLGRVLLPIGRAPTARSAIRGVLRRVLADHPFGVPSPRRGARAAAREVVRPPRAS